jgi:ABC-type uncharacterized transport system substrate-binding protein
VAKSNANALFVLPDDPPTFNLRRRIITFARERALPLLAPYREVVEDGALVSYGESYEDAAQSVALYARRSFVARVRPSYRSCNQLVSS